MENEKGRAKCGTTCTISREEAMIGRYGQYHAISYYFCSGRSVSILITKGKRKDVPLEWS